ncbi:MAG TPA: bifunctional oligoribonuclease/PAP phosphatase NrnA [Aggregatilineales bacterium]|nr:bifunctional oligoribonuclease/PAP phosphatase NrnA [Anaerolineales bacterium]HRE46204.1 bifunctional oligoribonuclease/PAP phosphatase NrnA [Aggregatilineales bacterium]
MPDLTVVQSLIQLDWERATALVQEAGRILILTHINPDGDAIGSARGLAFLLEGLGKQVTIAVDGGTPRGLSFLPGTESILPTLHGVSKDEVDLVIVTDCSDERRIGQVGIAARGWQKPWINLDHHKTNTLFAEANLVHSVAASATEIVMDWAAFAGWTVSLPAAECLLCGLVTDTLCFRTNSTTPTTLEKAQQLMRHGASLSKTVQQTVNRLPTAVILLWGKVLPRMRVEDGVIWTTIPRAIDLETGANGSDGALASVLLQAEDACFACVITEEKNGVCDISLRAKPGYAASAVALSLGGGGHTLAAGAQVSGTLEEVEALVIPMLKAAAKGEIPHS